MPARDVLTLLSTAVAATGDTFPMNVNGPARFEASLAGTNTVTATVIIEGTNTPTVSTSWLTENTLTLSGTTTAHDGFSSASVYPFIRGRVSVMSATSAIVTASL